MRGALEGALKSGVTKEEKIKAENQKNYALNERDNSHKQRD